MLLYLLAICFYCSILASYSYCRCFSLSFYLSFRFRGLPFYLYLLMLLLNIAHNLFIQKSYIYQPYCTYFCVSQNLNKIRVFYFLFFFLLYQILIAFFNQTENLFNQQIFSTLVSIKAPPIKIHQLFTYIKTSILMSIKRDKQSRDKNRSKNSAASNRSGLSSVITPYQDLRYQMQKLLESNNQRKEKDSARGRTKASISSQNSNQNNIIKCFMHQPIVNNFISISQDQPVKIKTSLKEEKNKLGKETVSKNVIEKRHFHYKYIIGKGGFGKVWKVEHAKTRNQFAMKQMLKSIVLTKKSVQSIINQQKLLSNLNSPFIVNMHYAFQDRQTLYLVLDLMEGGDLRHHLSCKTFTELQTKFFVACIVLGLEYLHNNLIIHRDIKPQNLVLDNRGYIRITDLGIARIYRQQNSSDTSGTPGYMSPEVICRQNHTYVSDLFALGVITHELMLGKRPYNGYSRQQIRQHILSKQASVKPYEIPQGWSTDSIDFINRLLQRRPEQRLGYKGIQQIKQHPWIQGINWKSLYKKQIQSPFLPLMKKEDFDQDEKITVEDEDQAELIQKNSLLLRKSQFQELFKQYYFDQQRHQSQYQQTNIANSSTMTPHQQLPGRLSYQEREQAQESKYRKTYGQSQKISSSNNSRQKNFPINSTQIQSIMSPQYQNPLYPTQTSYQNANVSSKETPKGSINNNVVPNMTYSMPMTRNNSKYGDKGKDGSSYAAKQYRF